MRGLSPQNLRNPQFHDLLSVYIGFVGLKVLGVHIVDGDMGSKRNPEPLPQTNSIKDPNGGSPISLSSYQKAAQVSLKWLLNPGILIYRGTGAVTRDEIDLRSSNTTNNVAEQDNSGSCVLPALINTMAIHYRTPRARTKLQKLLHQNLGYGTMRDDSTVVSAQCMGFQLNKLRKFTSKFTQDLISFITNAQHDV